MPGSDPSIDLLSSDLLEEDDVAMSERASLLHAAASAPSIAMLTGTHGVVVPPLTKPDAKLPPAKALAPASAAFEDRQDEGRLTALLRARLVAVPASDDPVGALRVRLELARALRGAGSADEAAVVLAEASELAKATSAALERERRQELMGRGRYAEQIACVSALAESASDPRSRADHLAERGRLAVASGDDDARWEASARAHRAALGVEPGHAAATYGYEVALDMSGAYAELELHLAELAERSATGEPASLVAAAWLHVERAALLDDRLSEPNAARAALVRALSLAPGKGPVRDACVDHASRHRDDAWLAELLEAEAALESDAPRAARLELDAALAHERSGAERGVPVRLLERALARAGASETVDERVTTELARLLDAEGRHGDALRVRKLALRRASDSRAELVLLRAIATSAERAGQLDEAVLALERARVVESDDPALLADLDRLLGAAGRHEQRAVAWVREAALVDDPESKARALVEASRAARAAGREEEAKRHLQSAWIVAPAAPGVYDALAGELAPAGAREAVLARVALYEQAVRATRDPDKKVGWLEKIAWLWDDVAGDAAAAVRAYEAVLAIEPARPSAIAGLASCAARAGDDRALARALLAEADVTADPDVRARVRLRGAEVLASVDRDRALALAADLVRGGPSAVASQARTLVTRLHADAGRWGEVAASLAERAELATSTPEKVSLALAEADVALRRLGSPDRAVAALGRARSSAPDDAALVHATLEALEALGDPERVRAELEALAGTAREPARRTALFVRLAELDEHAARDEAALDAYGRALEASPTEAFVVDRIVRLGARMQSEVAVRHPELVPLVRRARRELEAQPATPLRAETLLASPTLDFPTLRLAERLARRARAAPQLANALALQADAAEGALGVRALSGLAELVAWTLPPSDDVEPWDRLVERGSEDVTVVDELARRADRGPLDDRVLGLLGHALVARIARETGDSEKLLLLLDLATVHRRKRELRAAELACITALGHEPSSVTASTWLAELAAETGNTSSAILAATTFASLSFDPQVSAAFLSDASDLELARGKTAEAATLLERAIAADPDSVLVAARLADVQARRGAWEELGRTLRSALAAARTAAAIVPMASELAQVARERLKDPILAIEALERAREVSPNHTPSRFVLAELYIGQRVWDRALTALGEIVERGSEKNERLVALTGRAAVLARGLARLEDAEAELRRALEIEPHDPRAVRLLVDIAKGRMSGEERANLLSRLALTESVPERRILTMIELAEARRAVGDLDGMEGALIEAAAISPDPAMLDRVRDLTKDDPTAFVRVVSRAIARARDQGLGMSPAWLARLGQIEADVLGKHDEAIEHLRDALEADPKRLELRPLLVRVLVSTGRNPEAAAEAMPLFATPQGAQHVDGLTLRLLEASLAGSGRPAEARIARELRALAGTMDARERAQLDVACGSLPTEPDALGASTLRALLPTMGRHPIWDVAQVSMGIQGKLTRVPLGELGASTRERVKPRAPHPLRVPFERALRTFGLKDIELAVSAGATRPGVAVEDETWIVLPESLVDAPDAVLDAALVAPLALVALGVPALDTSPAADVLGALYALGRQVTPGFGAGTTGQLGAAIEAAELRARRALDRRRKRTLEELRDALDAAEALAEAAFAQEVGRLVARLVLLVTGDLRASLGALSRVFAPAGELLRSPHATAVTELVKSPLPRDLLAFALGGEASAHRQRLGISLAREPRTVSAV